MAQCRAARIAPSALGVRCGSSEKVLHRHHNFSVLVSCSHSAMSHYEQKRAISLFQKVHSFTEMKLANLHTKKEGYSSKDIPHGPRHGVGFDPVVSHYFLKKMTGPLRRKQNTTPDDFLNVDEAEKWMNSKQAAKVLGIKEDELPTLTRTVLEEKWAAAYRERNNAQQEEVLIATEVLLEYLDSTLSVKKSRQYYRTFLQNARVAVDYELEEQRKGHHASMIWALGFLIFGASVVVVLVAVGRKHVTRDDVHDIGQRAAEYMLMTFLQPKNTEPPPDYSTRYFNTPSAMDVDVKLGRYDVQFNNAYSVKLLEEKAAYDRREEAEMLKLLNDENERAERAKPDELARASRVAVYNTEDMKDDTRAPSVSPRGDAAESFNSMSFKQFSSMIANNFGGGSRFQRITNDTTARAEEMEATKKRMQTKPSL